MKTSTLALALLAVHGVAFADDAAVLRCRALTESSARLACYDAISVGAAAATAPRAAAPTPTPTPATAAAAAAVVPTAPPAPQAAFGMQQSAADEIKFIDSQINGRFQGWNADQLIELANGQVWRIADGSRAFIDAVSPKVRIERGTFGAFYLSIAGTNQTPRVRRVK